MYKEFCDTLISNKYEVIIIDAVNHRISDFDIFYQKVKENGFWTVSQVFYRLLELRSFKLFFIKKILYQHLLVKIMSNYKKPLLGANFKELLS